MFLINETVRRNSSPWRGVTASVGGLKGSESESSCWKGYAEEAAYELYEEAAHVSSHLNRHPSWFKRMMALCVSSHYKNSPNDLQLLADAPAHHLFVLLGPVDESKNQLPDILCVVQVCLEGHISQKSAKKSLREGHSPNGDQIPWKFCEQFRDVVFPELSGARIVRIERYEDGIWVCCG